MLISKMAYYERLSFDKAFVGARALRLTEIIGTQGDELVHLAGSIVPSRAISTILFIADNGRTSLVEISRALCEQHQLTAQRTTLLEELALINRKPDPNDQRRKTFGLTKRGKEEVKLIEELCRDAVSIFEDLNRELGFDLGAMLDAAYHALSKRSMIERLKPVSDVSNRESARE